jgi:hypothetical protein
MNGHGGLGIFEWVFWVLGFAFFGMALFRSEKLSTGPVAGVRLKSGLLAWMWVLGIAFALAGFVTAIIAMRENLS